MTLLLKSSTTTETRLTSTAATATTTAPMSPLKKKVTSLRRMVKGARKAMEQRPDTEATSSSTLLSLTDESSSSETLSKRLYNVRQKAHSANLTALLPTSPEKSSSAVTTTTTKQQRPKSCDNVPFFKNGLSNRFFFGSCSEQSEQTSGSLETTKRT